LSQGSFLIDVPESDPQLEDTSQFEGAIVAWGCNDDFQMGTMGYAFPFAAEQVSRVHHSKKRAHVYEAGMGICGMLAVLVKPQGMGHA